MSGASLVWQDGPWVTPTLEAAYRELLVSAPATTPFNHVGWLQAAAEAAEPGETVAVLWAWRDGVALGCLPLIVASQRVARVPVRLVRHLGFPLADRIGLAVRSDSLGVLGEMLRAVTARFGGHIIQWNELVVTPEIGKELESFGRARCFRWDRELSCRVPRRARTPADCEESSLPKEVKLELRRSRRRLEDSHGVVRRIEPTSDSIDALVLACKAVEDASWKGEDEVGIFSGERRTRWMQQAFRAWAADDAVRAITVEVNGQVVSYRLGPFADGVFFDYNIAFLPEMRRLGAGRLLLDEALRWSVDAGWRFVDASRVSITNSSHQLFERPHELVDNERWTFVPRSVRLLPYWVALSVRAWRKANRTAPSIA
jgi:CelD/BcsL family acetyltransferase involved in cellulose biosynthesis